MSRPRRALVWSVWAAVGLLVALTGLILFLLTTQPGAAFVVGYLDGKLPVDLAVGDVGGRLVGPLELGNVRLAASGIVLEVDHLAVRWRPHELLNGRRLHLEAVRIDGLRVAVRGTGEQGLPADSTPPTGKEALERDSLSLPIELIFDDLRVHDASFSVPGVLEARQVDLNARGTLESYNADLTAVFDLKDSLTAAVAATGTGALNSFALDSFQAKLLHGELRAQGAVAWRPEVAWQLAVEADTLAPADLAPNPADWPGRVSLTGTTRGGTKDGQTSVRVDVDTLHGALRGQPIAGSLSGSIAGSEYDISRADIDWGRIRIDAAGGISRQRLAVEFELEAPDLGAALPRASGSVSAAGKLGGSPSSPQVAASFQAAGVTVGTLRLDSARGDVDLDWAARGRNQAVAILSGLAVANQVVDSARLELRGSKESHELTFRAASDGSRVALRADSQLAAIDNLYFIRP